MTRYFLEMAFRGTAFHGWQVQKNAISVQSLLNHALSVLMKEIVETTGAGRTDTGVHARYFVAHFDSEKDRLAGNTGFLNKLNRILHPDISVFSVRKVPAEAHARFDAMSRTYVYQIITRKDPFMQDYAWQLRYKPEIHLMNKAAGYLRDVEDFTSFSRLHSQTHTNICKVSQAEWSEQGELLVFTITADRFLRNMVRAIVGTLVDVGRGKTNLEEFMSIIGSKNRSNAGQSVPAKGLFLSAISYPANYELCSFPAIQETKNNFQIP
jgi:tRNA pseudouridine38-40 synthase